jgi:ribonuclease P protein component
MNPLKKNYEFKRVLSRGKCINGKFLAIYVFPNKLKEKRVGFAIGKKAGKAHDRNRIRRLIRENYRLIEKGIELGLDIVFVWKNKVPADRVEYKQIEKDVSLLINFCESKK